MMYVVVEFIDKKIEEGKMSRLEINPNGSVFLAFFLFLHGLLKVLPFYLFGESYMQTFVSINLVDAITTIFH